MKNSNRIIVEAHNLWKVYRPGKVDVPALRGVDVAISAGQFLSIIGPSGSGKSTLLSLLAGLDQPTRGTVCVDGLDLTRASRSDILALRRHKMGFIFQGFHLIPTLTALENVLLPLRYARIERHEARRVAEESLAQVGLSDRLHHRPNEMSGGEQQRVAIARAIARHPQVVLADEPTGELDTATSWAIIELLQQLHRDQGTTFIIVTHNPEIAEATERVITLKDGVVREDRQGRQYLEAPL